MPNDYFQFKQFLINQDRSAFKVGTDGVLLGAWASVEKVRSILDIGTGTGLIALMLAQRTHHDDLQAEAKIVALEVDQASCEQAAENVRISPWKGRIEVIHQSLQEYGRVTSFRFDLVVSNPPFFRGSLKPEDSLKKISRHDTLLGMDDLIMGVAALLTATGRFCVILPNKESEDLQRSAEQMDLHLTRMLKVRPTPELPVKRHVLEFMRCPSKAVEITEIAIERGSRHYYTDEYKVLTRDFYLAF